MGIIITHIRETYQPTSVMRRDRGILMAQLHNLRFTATTEYHGVSDWGFTKKHGGSAMADWSNVGHCHWLWIILSGGYLSIWINEGYLFPTIDWSNVFFFLSLEPYTGCSKRGRRGFDGWSFEQNTRFTNDHKLNLEELKRGGAVSLCERFEPAAGIFSGLKNEVYSKLPNLRKMWFLDDYPPFRSRGRGGQKNVPPTWTCIW